jgi:hypothetical protein
MKLYKMAGKKNSWISFVMKIKKEEKLGSLKEAMERASKRKAEWKRGGNDEAVEPPMLEDNTNNVDETMNNVDETTNNVDETTNNVEEDMNMQGGKKRNVSQFAFGGRRRSRTMKRANRKSRSLALAGGARRSRRRSASLAQKRSRARARAYGRALA